MTYCETKTLYTFSDNLEELKFVAFSQKDPYTVGYTNNNNYFKLYNTLATCALKVEKRLECASNCFCLYDDGGVTLGLDDGTIKILDFEKNKCAFESKAHDEKVCSVDINPYSKLFVTSSNDGTLKVWDIRIKNAFRSFNFQQYGIGNIVKFSPDGTWVAASCDSHVTILYDIISNKIVNRFTQPGSYSFINFHPDELMLSICSKEGDLSFWELSDFSKNTSVKIEEETVCCTKFHEDGLCLLIGTASGKILSLGWDSNSIYDCTAVDNSDIRDIFYHENKIGFISSIDNHISVFETPYEILESSQQQIISESDYALSTMSKTFSRSQNNQTIVTVGTEFKFPPNESLTHSTPINSNIVVPDTKTISEKLEIFNDEHKSICQIALKRIKTYEIVYRMLKIKNIIGAFKEGKDCNDHVIIMDIIRTLTINIKKKSDFPYNIVIRNLKRLLCIPDTDFFICHQLSHCLNSIHSIDSKITRQLKLFYDELIKIKDPNKNINLMKLIVSIHVNN